MHLLPWKNKGFLILLSITSMISLQCCMNIPCAEGTAYTNSFIAFGMWIALFCLYITLSNHPHWNEIESLLNKSLFFTVPFAAAMICGAQLEQYGNVNFSKLYLYFAAIVLSISWAPVCSWCFWKLAHLPVSAATPSPRRHYFITIWLLLILSYLPTLLAAWPGFFSYDAEAEAAMVFMREYSTHHPIVHVLLLGGMLRLANHFFHSYNAGITTYLILQIILVSGCFAYMMNFLRSIHVRRSIRIIGLLFLAFFPTVSMFMCCTTKDVYFSGGIVLFTTLLLEMAGNSDSFWHSKRKISLLVLSLLLILLFRNNGIYAYVLFLLFFVFVYKKHWKKLLSSSVLAIALYAVIASGLAGICKAAPGEFAEMLCVPMQQLARVHAEAKDTLPPEDKELLYTLIPEVILENYNPKLADNIKVNFLEDNFKAAYSEYFLLWLKTGSKHPGIYINSFLENTYGYWYPDTVLDGYTGKRASTLVYGNNSYFAAATESPGTHHSLIPVLDKFYHNVSLEIYVQKVPVFSMLFSIGFWHWVYIFTAIYLVINKYKKQAFSLTFIGLVYLTVLFGPVALVRYVLCFFFCVPLILALLFDSRAFTQSTDRIED